MNRFRNILVYVNEPSAPDPALDIAVRLMEQTEAQVTLVDVEDELESVELPQELQDAALAKRRERLEQIAGRLTERGFRARPDVIRGNAATVIPGQVSAANYDLVLKTSRAASLATRLSFSSAGMRLIRDCPAAVWIVQPGHPSFDRIAVAIDPFADDGEPAELNQRLLHLATSVSRWDDCELHVAWVMPALIDSSMLRRIPYERIEQLNTELEFKAREKMSALLAEHAPGIGVEECHALHGVAGEEIPRFVHRYQIDLLVLGTKQRTGEDEPQIGNTAERILTSVGCSVLTCRPTDPVA